MTFSVSLVSLVLVSLSSVSLSDWEVVSVVVVVPTAVEVATSVLMAVVVIGKQGDTGGTVVEAGAAVADSPSSFASFSSISFPALDALASASSFYQGVYNEAARLVGKHVQKGEGNS